MNGGVVAFLFKIGHHFFGASEAEAGSIYAFGHVPTPRLMEWFDEHPWLRTLKLTSITFFFLMSRCATDIALWQWLEDINI